MFDNETELDDALSQPTDRVVDAVARTDGDVVVLGAGGKMGYSLTRMIKRASDAAGTNRRIVAVSRFRRFGQQKDFHRNGIMTLAGDLLDPKFLTSLPEAQNVVFMTGVKFGTGNDTSRTWAMNVMLPAEICKHYRKSRIMAFSTGNVYPFVPVTGRGSVETDPPEPVGEYAMTALGRERMFEYFSLTGNLPVSIVRLNYAVEMRYGVLVDLAMKVAREETIDLAMGHVNVIWQGDANAWALCALADVANPPYIINVAGPEILKIRTVCETFATLFDKPARFAGNEQENALLNNGQQAQQRYGPLRITAEQLIQAIASWILRGQKTWDLPTHFQTRNGQF